MSSNNDDFQSRRFSTSNIPAEPGTTPIPEGHVRLYHYTTERAIPGISQVGLHAQHAGRAASDKEPALVWATEHAPAGGKDQFHLKPVVEFHVPKEVWEKGASIPGFQKTALDGPIHPSNVIAIHEPWHSHARVLLSQSPEERQHNLGILKNNFNRLDVDTKRAVQAVSSVS